MYFKYLKYLLLLSVIIYSCDDIERDNILDPKNPSSHRPHVISVEAFVNTNDSLPYNYNIFLLEALDQLETIYMGKITIAEYHRKINNDYPDGYDSNDNEILYNTYFQGINSGIKGVPDVFVNGIESRVQGASSAASVLFRLQEVLNPMVSQNSYFTIEPLITQDGNDHIISAKIARLGSTDAEHIIMKAVIISKYDNGLHERVVTEYLKSQEIENISNGEIKEINIGETPISQLESKVIFMITSEDELQVFQSLSVSITM